jgi:hypothetical protein
VANDPTNDHLKLQTAVHNSLRTWNKQDSTAEELLESLLIVQLARRELPNPADRANRRMATNAVLEKALDKLAEQQGEYASILRWRFISKDKLFVVANRLHVSPDYVSRTQRKAISQLTAVILAEETAARAEHTSRLEARLKAPTYSRLFGRDALMEKVNAQLLASENPWLVALVGIGGIGKTSLADKIVRQIIPTLRFEEIYWLDVTPGTLSGRFQSPQATFQALLSDLLLQLYPHTTIPAATDEQRLTAVRRSLKERPTLIVVDNLETASDMALLMNSLFDLANPSKFLLTTRVQISRQANVLPITVDELPLADASVFIRYHAQETGIEAVAEATEKDIAQIYQLTGGNPLALKIVISLLDMMPLDAILAGLTTNHPVAVAEMYRRIYWQAWQTLSDDARRLLKAMPLVGDEADSEYLAQISQLPQGTMWRAVEELRQRSLLEVRGGLHAKQYRIHPLTNSFLQTEIINLPLDEDEKP